MRPYHCCEPCERHLRKAADPTTWPRQSASAS
jgi:hypothetical protein